MTQETNGTRGDAYLARLNSEGVPTWAKGMSFILTGLIGFILALGLDLGDVVTTYMSNQNQLESAALNQGGTVEANALAGLIQVNSGMTSHITDLIGSINNLINENTVLVNTNAILSKENTDLKLEVEKQKVEITKLTKELQDLQTRNELGVK